MSEPTITTKRIYDDPDSSDGLRVLVDRLWPRGMKKDDAAIDDWLKELAPSDDLRKWFQHDADKWPQFKKRYFDELAAHKDALHDLLDRAHGRTLTLLYSARDTDRNNAVAMAEYLRRIAAQRKP